MKVGQIRRPVAVVLVAALVFVGALGIARLLRFGIPAGQQHHPQASKEVYYCPMHPTYTSDRPGDCPICGMKLVKREEQAKPKEADGLCTLHNCPMVHDGRPCPMLVVSKPGEEVTCPVCGTHVAGAGMEASASMPVGPEGYAAILISPEKRQMIGVRTAPARRQKMARTIRTVGVVRVDETRIVHVHPKVEGWIGETYARYEGDAVKKGQPLFSFSSPDFISVQQEFLGAARMLKEMPADAGPQIREAAEKNAAAARQRLLWWDVTPQQIEELDKGGLPAKALVLASPMDGIVLKKHVWAGEFMERGADFYHIADLSSVWVDARLYEMDLAVVRAGQEASVAFPDRPDFLRGKVAYVSPTLDPETRTATARLEFSNADGRLKPGMFATAEISVDLGERLAVPAEAVLDSGTRRILFVDEGKGLLEPREVAVGAKGDGVWEILSGLEEGETVVVSGNFLVDSESRLGGALEGAGGHRHGS